MEPPGPQEVPCLAQVKGVQRSVAVQGAQQARAPCDWGTCCWRGHRVVWAAGLGAVCCEALQCWHDVSQAAAGQLAGDGLVHLQWWAGAAVPGVRMRRGPLLCRHMWMLISIIELRAAPVGLQCCPALLYTLPVHDSVDMLHMPICCQAQRRVPCLICSCCLTGTQSLLGP